MMRLAVRCQLVCFGCGKVIVDDWTYSAKTPIKNLLAAAKATGAKIGTHEIYCGTDCLTEAHLKYGLLP